MDKRQRHAEKKKWMVFLFKAYYGCRDCGETNPILLDLDHRDIRTKGPAIAERWGLAKMWRELQKCEVRCVACHRLRTARQQHWYDRQLADPRVHELLSSPTRETNLQTWYGMYGIDTTY